MSNIRKLASLVLSGLLWVAAVPPKVAQAADDAIDARMAVADGLKIHYLIAGHGPSVILLHGYAETSRMWRPLIPLLAKRFTVIAPDLPGIGDSDIPTNGIDMKTAAIRIHDLAHTLG